MRMAAPDIVLFVVGALLFSGASFAIYQQGGDLTEQSSALGLFNVAYEGARTDLETADVASFRSVEQTFEVNATEVGTVFVVIDCNDQAPGGVAAFTLQIEITPPPASNLTPTTNTGNCAPGMEFPIAISEKPANTRADGDSESEARADLEPTPNATKAQGTWTITISGARSSPAGGLPLPQDPTAPGGSITLAAEVWEPRFTPVQR